MQFEVIDNCPVPAVIAPQVRLLKHDVPSAVLQSGYRGDLAMRLLKRLGKSTQAMLYNGFLRHLPGYNPANPPGFSTHELHSDGVAYRGPRGRLLRPFQCGLDWNDAAVPLLIAAARKRGWDLFRPYASGSEYHHLNFRSYPKLIVKPKAKRVPPAIRPHLIRGASKAGVDLIAGFEGCRLQPYQDVVGVWTVGYGHTGAGTQQMSLKSVAEAKALLAQDLTIYVAGVRKLVKVPVTQHQFDALVSFAYNLGVGALGGSTLLERLNGGHYAMAANQFLSWDMAGGKHLLGLTRRRKAERALFLAGSNQKTRAAAATGVR